MSSPLRSPAHEQHMCNFVLSLHDVDFYGVLRENMAAGWRPNEKQRTRFVKKGLYFKRLMHEVVAEQHKARMRPTLRAIEVMKVDTGPGTWLWVSLPSPGNYLHRDTDIMETYFTHGAFREGPLLSRSGPKGWVRLYL